MRISLAIAVYIAVVITGNYLAVQSTSDTPISQQQQFDDALHKQIHSTLAHRQTRDLAGTHKVRPKTVQPGLTESSPELAPPEYTRHKMAGKAGQAAMAHEMGHEEGMSMETMVRDMQRRFIVALVFAIPVFIYSPLFTQVFQVQAPLPFGASNELISFVLATPAVLYGGWVFYVGAWRALNNRVLNMAVLVSLSVLAGYLFSVGATFFFKSEVFYEAASLLLVFVLFGHLMEMRARAGTSQAIRTLMNLAPPKATVIRDGRQVELPTSEVRGGDIVLIRQKKKSSHGGGWY
jgi:Cu2+-exporting ATPase